MPRKPTETGSKDLENVRLLKDEHVKKLFGISQSCLYKWRKKKMIPHFKMGSVNYYLEDVILKMLYLRGGKLPEDFDDEA